MIHTDKTYKHLLFCGDIHDNYDAIPNFIRDHELDNCAVFQVGDFGIGFILEQKEEKRLNYLNNRMKISNSDVFAIRGNHDNPKYFTGETKLSNVTLLKDYSVVNINGWNILGVGGAVSVDRWDRPGFWKPEKKRYSWWKDEVFVLREDILNELRDIDIVITHSAPNFCNPLTKTGAAEWIEKDKDLALDLTIERGHLAIMYEILRKNNKISEWYYGHFHYNTKTYYDNAVFYALDIDNLVQSNKFYNYGENN